MTRRAPGWPPIAAVVSTLTILGVCWQAASFLINLRRDVDDLRRRDQYQHGSYPLPEKGH